MLGGKYFQLGPTPINPPFQALQLLALQTNRFRTDQMKILNNVTSLLDPWFIRRSGNYHVVFRFNSAKVLRGIKTSSIFSELASPTPGRSIKAKR